MNTASLLCERKVLEKPTLYLSCYFKRHRQEYYDRLQAVRDDGAWEAWLTFFLRGVTEVSQQATHTVRDILALREEHCQVITTNLNRVAGNAHLVLEKLFMHPPAQFLVISKLLLIFYAALVGCRVP